MNSRALSWLFAALVLVLASVVTSCSQYYTPPPPVAVLVSSSTGAGAVALLMQQSDGTWTTGTLQMQASVQNASSQTVTWSINNGGADVVGGNSTLGTIDSSGLYTAPAVLPNPSTIVITATPQADPTRPATMSLQLYTPLATVSSVSPSTVVAGKTYTITVNGVNFYNTSAASATLNVSGAQVASVSFPSGSSPFSSSLTAQIVATSPGLLQVAVQNPQSAGTTNPFSMVSAPATPSTSSTLGVMYGQVGTDSSNNPVYGNIAYVPQSAANLIDVVNLDAGTKMTPFTLPSGFSPASVAVDPANNTIVAVSGSKPQLAVMDGTSGKVINTWPVTVTGTAHFNDGVSCQICGVLVDATRNLAIVDTADGYQTINLATGAVGATIPTSSGENASENFTYDPFTQRIWAPWYNNSGAGINRIDLTNNTVAPYALPATASFTLGSVLSAAVLDQVTQFGAVRDQSGDVFTGLNLNNQTADGNGNVTAPAQQFTLASACGGGWNGLVIDPYNHLGFFTNTGGCIALGTLAQAPGTGPLPGPGHVYWAQLGTGPDGVNWTNTTAPLAIATYVGLDGTTYGVTLRQDGLMLAKIDLQTLEANNILATDTTTLFEQMDPANPTAAVTYISLK